MPPGGEADIASRVAQTLQIWATIAGSLVIVAGFIKGVWKPYILWRREHQARVIREVLKPELEQLQQIIKEEGDCKDGLNVVLSGLRDIYGDHDDLVAIALDNRERLDETNDFLDAIGFSSDRRVDLDKRKLIDAMMVTLRDKRRERRFNPAHPKHFNQE